MKKITVFLSLIVPFWKKPIFPGNFYTYFSLMKDVIFENVFSNTLYLLYIHNISILVMKFPPGPNRCKLLRKFYQFTFTFHVFTFKVKGSQTSTVSPDFCCTNVLSGRRSSYVGSIVPIHDVCVFCS